MSCHKHVRPCLRADAERTQVLSKRPELEQERASLAQEAGSWVLYGFDAITRTCAEIDTERTLVRERERSLAMELLPHVS